MTDPSGFGSGARLTFNAPLSNQRANRLAAHLASHKPATILDVGCGWGELLLRILLFTPDARGTGIDVHGPDIARATENAETRRLADRVTFLEAPGAGQKETADLVVSVGAYQAFGSIPEAFDALRDMVNPGGRLLFAAEMWNRSPTADELANMWPGTTVDDCLTLAAVVDAAVEAGFRPLNIETSTREEWEEFESGFAAGSEEWLLANPGHSQAAEVTAKLDAHRDIWLRGHRDVLGFAFLTLGVPAAE
jgi:SAM-dependent methyltransferase